MLGSCNAFVIELYLCFLTKYAYYKSIKKPNKPNKQSANYAETFLCERSISHEIANDTVCLLIRIETISKHVKTLPFKERYCNKKDELWLR